MLPGEYFTAADIWRLEQTRIFHNHWLLAGHVSALPVAGDYLTLDIAGSSVFVCMVQQANLTRTTISAAFIRR